jgi:RNA polymerase sigma factor (sigma-70 family)
MTTDTAVCDAELVTRFAQKQDEEAFAVLLRRHGQTVRWRCRNQLGAKAEDAEDACQEAFLVLMKEAKTLPRPEGVGKWLWEVARRRCLNILCRPSRTREWQDEPGEPIDDDPDPRERMIAEEDVWGIRKELERIPEDQRRAFVRCELEGEKPEHVAQTFGVPTTAGAVRALVQRCKATLRKAEARNRCFWAMWSCPTRENIDCFLAHLETRKEVTQGHGAVACRLVIALNMQAHDGIDARTLVDLAEMTSHHAGCALAGDRHLDAGQLAGTLWDVQVARFHAWRGGRATRCSDLLDEFVHSVESSPPEYLLRGYTLAQVAAIMFRHVGDKAAHDTLLEVGRKYCAKQRDPGEVMEECVRAGLLGDRWENLPLHPWIPSFFSPGG